MDIHDKHYNKWFMSKVPTKQWQQDSKFKLKVHMMEMNAIQEYEDVELHNETYENKCVSRIVKNAEITGITGKLQRV